jgi:VWFA-related protein
MAIFSFRHLYLCAALAMLGGGIGFSFASAQEKQEKQEKKDEPVSTIRVDTDLVSVDVTVTDRKGHHSAIGLRAEDFSIYEDGVRQRITNFSTSDVPFNLVALIDTSGSTRDEVTLMRRAVQRFLDELRPQDRVALIHFNKQVELLEDLTSERPKLEAALNRLKPGTGTSFYDALQLTVDDVLKKVDGRKAIIALTDGVDSYGFNTFDQVMPALESAGASIYFLELNTEAFTEAGMMRDCKENNHFEFSGKQMRKYFKESLKGGNEVDYEDHCALSPLERMQINRRLYQTARREVREMATRTGGRVYPVKQIQQIDPAYAQIAAELRTQYSLGYYPLNEKHDGKWRTLKVEVKRNGFVAHARPGYRAPQD